MCTVGKEISEENQACFQSRRIDFLILSEGGLLVAPGICSENKRIYLVWLYR